MPVEAGTSETSGSGIAGEAPPPAEPFVWFPLWYAIQFFFSISYFMYFININ
jgi:hypothetical protein